MSTLTFLTSSLLLASASFALCPSATTQQQTQLANEAKAVLDGNWVPQMNSTLPSPNLYPHQWSWDAAFIAIGYSHYDTARAIDETEALFRGQWKNGLLPHIVFNPATDESYFPGPTFWQIETSASAPDNAATSGIIQPPVHAISSLSIYKNARTTASKKIALDHLKTIYPKLALWHQYLYTERDPLNEGLVFLRHMWESGMDNSPAWDAALEAIEVTPDMIPAYTRVDKGKVGHAKERPTSFFYDRAVYLIKLFYDNSYDEAAIFEKSPFLVQDVLFNSILSRAGIALAEIADILGLPEDAQRNRERSAKTAAAITSKLYDPVEKFYFNYNMVTKSLIPKKISGGFGALFGAEMDDVHVNSLVQHLYSPAFLGEDLSSWTIPSVAKNDPGYTNTTYWKGPAWLNINYIVRDGLMRKGKSNPDALKIGEYLKDRSIEMIGKVGFYEYFNPISGTPHGGHQFSWSAALVIDWICNAGTEVPSKPSSKDGENESLPKSALSGVNMLYGTVLVGTIALIAAVVNFVNTDSKESEEEKAEILELLHAAEKKARADATPVSGSVHLRRRTLGAIVRRST